MSELYSDVSIFTFRDSTHKLCVDSPSHYQYDQLVDMSTISVSFLYEKRYIPMPTRSPETTSNEMLWSTFGPS